MNLNGKREYGVSRAYVRDDAGSFGMSGAMEWILKKQKANLLC